MTRHRKHKHTDDYLSCEACQDLQTSKNKKKSAEEKEVSDISPDSHPSNESNNGNGSAKIGEGLKKINEGNGEEAKIEAKIGEGSNFLSSAQSIDNSVESTDDRLAPALNWKGCSLNEIGKVYADALQADKPLVYEGKVCNTVPDHDIRLKAAQVLCKIYNLFNESPRNISLNQTNYSVDQKTAEAILSVASEMKKIRDRIGEGKRKSVEGKAASV